MRWKDSPMRRSVGIDVGGEAHRGAAKGNVKASKIKIFFSYEQNLFCV